MEYLLILRYADGTVEERRHGLPIVFLATGAEVSLEGSDETWSVVDGPRRILGRRLPVVVLEPGRQR